LNLIVKTRYFEAYEMACKCGCGRLNYCNLFIMYLEVFRDILNFPLMVTSGCRCKSHNKAVGGKSNSCHECTTKLATAVDVKPYKEDYGSCEAIYNLAVKLGFFNEVIWYKSSGFVHLGIDKNQNYDYYKIEDK